MTWLYIPSNCVPESACSEKAPALHSSFLDTNTAPFATWSGKPLLPRNLSALWKRERSIRRLSGLTCLPSTAQRGADAWICSLRASPARTSALPGGARALMASARACSSTSSTLPMLAERGGLFWRTSAPSLLPPPPLWTKPKGLSTSARPPASWENWPTAGGTRSGSLFPRPTWVPAMGGRAGSAGHGGVWLTPNVPNGGRSVSAEMVASKGMTEDGEKHTVGLESQTRHWATPDCNTSTRCQHNSQDSGMALSAMTQQWPTPNAHDGRRPGADLKSTQGANLSRDAAIWPTPRATDGTKGGPNQAGSKGDLMLPSAAAQWPTPMAQDSESAGSANANMTTLFRATQQWPTPASRDYRTPNSESLEARGGGSKGEQLPNFVQHHFSPLVQPTPFGATSSVPVVSVHGSELSPTTKPEHVLGRLRLNPAFACWLMGWPSWWTNPGLTNCARPAMALYRCRLQWHLSSLCGAQQDIEKAAA